MCLDVLVPDVGRSECLVLTFLKAPPSETHLNHIVYHAVRAHCLGLGHDLPVQDVTAHLSLAEEHPGAGIVHDTLLI